MMQKWVLGLGLSILGGCVMEVEGESVRSDSLKWSPVSWCEKNDGVLLYSNGWQRPRQAEDRCLDRTRLLQYFWRAEKAVARRAVECPHGCLDGACQPAPPVPEFYSCGAEPDPSPAPTELEPSEVPEPIFQVGFDSDEEITTSCSTSNQCASVDGEYELTEGRLGSGLRITGAGHVAVPLNDVFTLDGAGAVEFWVRLDSIYGLQSGFTLLRDPGAATPWGLRIRRHPNPAVASSYLQVAVKSPSAPTETGIINKPTIYDWVPGQWHHVVMAWGAPNATDSKVAFYVDGVRAQEVDRTAAFPSLAQAPTHMRLAVNANALYTVDEFRTYDTILDPHQVAQRFRDGLDHSGPILQSGESTLVLLGAEDGFGIERFLGQGVDKLAAAPRRSLWSLSFQRVHSQTGNDVSMTLDNLAGGSAPNCLVESATGAIRLVWEDIELPNEDLTDPGDGGQVDVTVRFATDAPRNEIRGTIEVANESDEWRLLQTTFPIVDGIVPIGEVESNELLVPAFSLGYRISDPFNMAGLGLPHRGTHESVAANYPSRQMSMQWTALLNADTQQGGLYFSAEDGAGWNKSLRWDQDALNETLGISLVTYAEHSTTAGNDHAPGFPVVFGLRDGSWFDVARRYREFAVEQSWTSVGPLAVREDSPDTIDRPAPWLLDAGVMQGSTFYNPTFLHSTLGVKAIAAANDVPLSALLWHFPAWQAATQVGTSRQANDNPVSMPWSPTLEWVCDARESGIGVAGYLESVNWDARYDYAVADPLGWTHSDGEAAAMRNKYGAIITTGNCAVYDCPPYAPPTPTSGEWGYHFVRMCPHAAGWQEVLTDLVGAMTDQPEETMEGTCDMAASPSGELPSIGFSGAYLDVLGAGNPRQCYEESHGHPAGGGTHYVSGLRSFLQSARARAKEGDLDAGFYTEDFAEPYIDLVEGYWAWHPDPGVDMIPFALAVYHDYAVFLGQSLDKQRTNASSIAQSAQELAWGMVLGTPLYPPYERMTVTSYRFTLAHYRQLFREYLVLGEMRRFATPRLVAEDDDEDPVLLVDEMAGEQVPFHQVQWYEGSDDYRPRPVVIASQWRSSKGGAGIVVVSTESSGDERFVYVPVNREELGLPDSDVVTVRHVDRDGTTTVGVLNGDGIRVRLAPQAVVLVELLSALSL